MSNELQYRLLSFDLDGTLVDTASEIAEAVNRALVSQGLSRRDESEIVELIGAGTRELMLKLLARIFFERPVLAEKVHVDALLDSLDHHYAQTTGTAAQVYPGGHEALERLRASGLKLACVTNKELRHAKRVLQVTRLDGYFDLLVGGDSLAQKKPHPSVLRQVAADLGVPTPRVAHVGDSSIDVAAARNAGVSAWAVPYGYNAGQPIEASRPQRIFQSLPEVADHVLSLPIRAAAA